MQSDEYEFLSSVLPFWDKLAPAQEELLLANATSMHFLKGQTIHWGEQECIGILAIRNGRIRTYITSEEGREITLFSLEDGDVCVLSASCVLEHIDFDVSVDADTDCDLIQISSSALAKLSAENVYVELFTYKVATDRFSDVMWAMQQLLFTSFDVRLANFLLEEAARNHSNDIHMTHEQIAKYLGSAREVVSRMLKFFAKEGYVTLSRGGIHIENEKGLRNLSRAKKENLA